MTCIKVGQVDSPRKHQVKKGKGWMTEEGTDLESGKGYGEKGDGELLQRLKGWSRRQSEEG